MTASRTTRRNGVPVQQAAGGNEPGRARTGKPAQGALDFSSPLDIVCGVDEAGRGPLAGPVVAAAVILDPRRRIRGLNDSKQLNAKTREALYEKIVERSIAYCVASASVEEIDTLNILHATMLAMKRAVEGLAVAPTLARIDGNRCPTLAIRSEAIIGGDALVPAISAASILAKVTRDRMLAELHEQFPLYGFDSHVGYGTPQHLAALAEHGPCAHHRRSFAPVREAYARRGVRTAPPCGVEMVEAKALEEAFERVDAGMPLESHRAAGTEPGAVVESDMEAEAAPLAEGDTQPPIMG